MDNISHTLIGALVGEAMARTARPSESGLAGDTRRNLLVGVMVAGSNFPDLDFVYSAITDLKLDYLLHHRGHTHTVVGAIISALITLAACEAWLRYRKLVPSSSDRAWLAGAALLGPLLHVAMDFGNSYGVHPFWPFYNGWLYGDSVFIVEPLFWAAAAPLVFTMRTLFTRALIALALVGGVAVSFVTGLVPTIFAVTLIVITVALLTIGRYCKARAAVCAGLCTWLVTIATFVVSGRVAANQIEIATLDSPFGELLDHVLTPMPVNPLCWEIILVQSDQERYTLRRAILSLAPEWIAASACPLRTPTETITAPLKHSSGASTDSLQWRGELVLSRLQLQKLAAEHCEVANLLRFARAPFVAAYNGGEVVGDLRYDREPQPGFAEVELGNDRCPSYAPQWLAPREDLLRD